MPITPAGSAPTRAVIAAGLERGAKPRLIKRAARLLQAYEKMFWDTIAS
jgi:hypothetical protein